MNCDANSNRGSITFCATADCGACMVAVPFADNECKASDPTLYGASSWAARCPGAAAAPVVVVAPSIAPVVIVAPPPAASRAPVVVVTTPAASPSSDESGAIPAGTWLPAAAAVVLVQAALYALAA
jgi:hypothetical protein